MSSPGLVLMAWPHPDVRSRLLVDGVRSSGQSPRVPVSSGRTQARADRTGEGLLKPPLMPRVIRNPVDGNARSGCRGWPPKSGRCWLVIWAGQESTTAPRGTGGTQPGRIFERARRGDPVSVRAEPVKSDETAWR